MKFNGTFLVLVGSIVGCQLLVAQPTPPGQPVNPPPVGHQSDHQPKPQQRINVQHRLPGEPGIPGMQAEPLPTFDLDFPGGTPAQLIAAIEKASSTPVNAVIPTEFAATQLPPLKMKQVNVPQLFQALMMATTKREKFVTSTSFMASGQPVEQIQQQETAYGFRTTTPGPDGVWYFYNSRLDQPSNRVSVSRFYHLDTTGKPYTIQDITTAIKTGWELLGIKESPTLKYHPETKLLIAVGQQEHLQLIDSVLRELGMRTDPSLRPGLPIRPPEAKKDGESRAK